MGPWEKYTVTANSSCSNYVANTDGTMTDLSVERMVEDLNIGLQFPLETLRPTHSLVQCLTTGVHILLHQNTNIIFNFV